MPEQPGDGERRFRLLVESVKDYAIFMLDKTGHVATWNVGAERIKGYTAAEILGQHFSRFYPREEVETGLCDRELEVATQEGRFEDEGWRVRKDGTRFWANVVITALFDDSGALVGFAKVTRDLTQRRRLEQERLRLVQAQETIRLRDEFLSIVSHELRTPLTALQLQLENLREKMRRSGGSTFGVSVDKAMRSAERLGDLMESLLDFSRIATGRLDLKRQRLDLANLVKQTADSLLHAAEKVGSQIRISVPTALTGLWDHVRTEQVVVNLLSNAIKFGAGFPIDVSLQREGAEAVLEVNDRGPGIAQEDLARIFERFECAPVDAPVWRAGRGALRGPRGGQRARRNRHRPEPQWGRSLLHGATPDHAGRRCCRAAGEGAAMSASSSNRARCVLVVEDDDGIRESLVELLSDHGYEAVGAAHGRDALAKLGALDPRPSVIVLDLMMPIMDGRSFREEQLRHPTLRSIPVIVISAYKDVSYDVQDLQAAAYLEEAPQGPATAPAGRRA